MTKLQKFSLAELSDLSYGITVMTKHYSEFIAHNSYLNDDPTFCATMLINFNEDLQAEIRLRIPELDMGKIDKAYQEKLLISKNTSQ